MADYTRSKSWPRKVGHWQMREKTNKVAGVFLGINLGKSQIDHRQLTGSGLMECPEELFAHGSPHDIRQQWVELPHDVKLGILAQLRAGFPSPTGSALHTSPNARPELLSGYWWQATQ